MLTTIENFVITYPILLSVISGIVSSAIFLFVLSRLKPSIRICNRIAYDPKTGKYLLKIINRSLFFKIYDINVNLSSICIVQTLNGENVKIQPIKLTLSSIRAMQRFNWKHLFQNEIHKENRLRSRTDYAAIFSSKEDLRAIIENQNFIRFEVYAKHTLTGFARIFTYDYKHSGNIIDGTYLSGNTFN